MSNEWKRITFKGVEFDYVREAYCFHATGFSNVKEFLRCVRETLEKKGWRWFDRCTYNMLWYLSTRMPEERLINISIKWIHKNWGEEINEQLRLQTAHQRTEQGS